MMTAVTSNFTSYLTEEALNSSEEAMQKEFKPKLLAGEIEAARVGNVSLLLAQQKRKKGANRVKDEKLGILLITNFRLSFVPFHDATAAAVEATADPTYQENHFLGKYDVSLSNIDRIYQITDKKKRLVGPQYKNSSKIESIRIVCKNFRSMTFGFSASHLGRGKYIADALVKFAFPPQHKLLFLYNFKEPYYPTVRTVRMFNTPQDWLLELERCGASAGWRVTNVEHMDGNSLPRHYVVPKRLSDHEYSQLAQAFRCGRTAVWVWGLESAALVRMAELLPTLTQNTMENTMMEHVRCCDPNRRQPVLMDLSRLLPSIQDVHHSYVKLRDLCAPESDRQFMLQDSRFYSLLDKSCWLLYVSFCLKYSAEAASRMRKGDTVVLQELDGRDMSCIVSSLVQLLLDPYWRTITGFQTLIQKEWVSLGHPFSDRLGHVAAKANADEGPLFLLFLDCAWQLLQQFPEHFEFSETLLTTLWDSAFLPVFDTFQFNCERDREAAVTKDKVVLRPVWDWGEQFDDKDIALFSNPLYKKPPPTEAELELNRRSRLPPHAIPLPGMEDARRPLSARLSRHIKSMSLAAPQHQQQQHQSPADRFLEPAFAVRDLELWAQCYFRWMPVLEIPNGGFPQVDLFNRLVVNRIHKLQKLLETGGAADGSPPTTTERHHAPDISINSFFPFSSNGAGSNNADLTDMLILNGELLADGSIFDASSLVYQTAD